MDWKLEQLKTFSSGSLVLVDSNCDTPATYLVQSIFIIFAGNFYLPSGMMNFLLA